MKTICSIAIIGLSVVFSSGKIQAQGGEAGQEPNNLESKDDHSNTLELVQNIDDVNST
jgi:hypothetical protein